MLNVALILLWIAWATAAVLSALLVRKFARRYERRVREAFQTYHPKAAVIVPFKGVELDLDQAIASLASQNYDDYQLICVVESEDDPAYPVLQRELARHPEQASQILVAGIADRNEGQKVHNLLAAIDKLIQDDAGEAVWAFADSDAGPGGNWLGDLVGPLGQPEKTGVTTGYRWLIPPEVSEKAGFQGWNHLASILNSSVACFYGRDRFNHAWGGSMAINRATAIETDLTGYLRGALSDDYQVTALCRSAKLRIYFVPQCLVASPVDFDRRSFLNFVRRQYIITRTHAPKLYFMAVGLLLVHLSGWISAWVALVMTGLHNGIVPALAIATVFIANQMRSTYRQRCIHNAFGSETAKRLRTTLHLDRWLTPVWLTVHLCVILSALATRTISWRGKRYRIDAPQKITQLN